MSHDLDVTQIGGYAERLNLALASLSATAPDDINKLHDLWRDVAAASAGISALVKAPLLSTAYAVGIRDGARLYRRRQP